MKQTSISAIRGLIWQMLPLPLRAKPYRHNFAKIDGNFGSEIWEA